MIHPFHANCDCEYAIRFNSRTTVAGYDPDKYLRQYENAGGDINAMRCIDYAANRERINVQKRATYAARALSTKQGKSATIELNNDRYMIAEPKISKFLLKAGTKRSAEFFDVGYAEQDTTQLNADIYHQEDGIFSIFMELGTDEKQMFRMVLQHGLSDKPD